MIEMQVSLFCCMKSRAFNFHRFYSTSSRSGDWKGRPFASQVLSSHLSNNGFPPWSSYFVKYSDVVDDQRGKSHFNWGVEERNYHILRTGCFPYIKYHCTQRPPQNLRLEDAFFRFIKVFNLGIPCLAYGIAAIFLIKHSEIVSTPKGNVTIYFLYQENRGSAY